MGMYYGVPLGIDEWMEVHPPRKGHELQDAR